MNLDDVNDAPVMSQDEYWFNTDESNIGGALVGTLSATDEDVGQTITHEGTSSRRRVAPLRFTEPAPRLDDHQAAQNQQARQAR